MNPANTSPNSQTPSGSRSVRATPHNPEMDSANQNQEEVENRPFGRMNYQGNYSGGNNVTELLPKGVGEILSTWMNTRGSIYPTLDDISLLAEVTRSTDDQVAGWFAGVQSCISHTCGTESIADESRADDSPQQ